RTPACAAGHSDAAWRPQVECELAHENALPHDCLQAGDCQVRSRPSDAPAETGYSDRWKMRVQQPLELRQVLRTDAEDELRRRVGQCVGEATLDMQRSTGEFELEMQRPRLVALVQISKRAAKHPDRIGERLLDSAFKPDCSRLAAWPLRVDFVQSERARRAPADELDVDAPKCDAINCLKLHGFARAWLRLHGIGIGGARAGASGPGTGAL